MRTQATVKYVRVSSRKAGLVLEQIRGKSVGEALSILEYTPRAAARLVEKVLRSAVANAEHNYQVRDLDTLRVVEAIADGGPSLKRVQPRAMGRAFFIRHRTSHLTVTVSDEVNGARRLAVPATAAAATPAPAKAAKPTAAPRAAKTTKTAKTPKAAKTGGKPNAGKGKEKG